MSCTPGPGTALTCSGEFGAVLALLCSLADWLLHRSNTTVRDEPVSRVPLQEYVLSSAFATAPILKRQMKKKKSGR